MTHSIETVTEAFPVAETVHANKDSRIVRISGYYSNPTGHSGGIQETFVQLCEGGVTFCHTSSLKKPKNFSMDAETADTFCQAWQEFRAARKAMHEQEQAEYLQNILDLQARVSDLGGNLITNDKIDSFDLEWATIHPIHGLYKQETCLGKHDVEDRLKHAEQLIKEVQESAVPANSVRDLEILDLVAAAFDAEIDLETGGIIDTYALTFAPDSPFHGFWTKESGLTLAQVDYRLRYVEGIKTR